MADIEVRINGRAYTSLLDPDGTRRLRTARRKQLAMALPVAIGFTAMTVLVAMFYRHVDDAIQAVALVESILLCLAMVYLGLWTTLQCLRIRPFVLTPQGFTLTRARVRDALARRDTFIPIGRLTRVLVDRPRFRGHPHIRLRLKYVDEKGRTAGLNLDSIDIDDPLEVMMHLKALAPRALDESVAPFIDPDITKRKQMGKFLFHARRSHPGMMIGMMTFLMIGTMSPLFIFMVMEVTIIVPILVYYGIILVMTYVQYIKVKSGLREMTFATSIATRTGITLPWMRLAALFVEPRRELPYRDVRYVNDGLDAKGWRERPRVRTWHGESFNVSRRTLRQMKDLAWFDFDGYTLLNRTSPPDGGAPMFRPNYTLLVPFVTGFLLLPWLMLGLFSLFGPGALIIIMVPVMAFPMVLFGSVFVFTIGTRRTKNMTVTPERLLIPRARPKFREVAVSDVLEVRAVRGVIDTHIVIETRRGRTKVPLEKAEDLLRGGYPIVDEHGLIGGAILNMMETPRPPPPAEVVPERPEDRGAQIGMETEDAVKQRKRDATHGAALFAFMTVVIFALLYIMVLLEDDPMGWVIWFFVAVFSLLFIIPVALFVLMRHRIRPQRYYEHGLEAQAMMGKMEFVPWTRFKWAHEWHLDGKSHLSLIGDAQSASVDASMDGYDRIVELVKRELGEKAFEETEASEQDDEPSQPVRKRFGFLPMGPTGPRLPLDEVPREIRLMNLEGSLGMASTFAALTVILLVGSVWVPDAAPPIDIPTLTLEEGEFLGMNGSFQGEPFRLEQPVVVRDGETLAISDTRLTIAPMQAPGAAIWVLPGGRLELVNTTIVPIFNGRGFSIEIEGSALIDGCNLTYEPALDRFQTGQRTIRVRSDDVIIRNSSFWGDLEVGVAVVGCSPVITGCTFGNVSVAGVAVLRGSAEVVDSRFERCEVGVLGQSGDLRVQCCTFIGNQVGVQAWDGNASVEGSWFEGNSLAIEYMGDKRPSITGTTFTGNFDDLEPIEDAFQGFFRVFLLFLMPLMVLPIVVMTVWTPTRWWEPDISRKAGSGGAASD